MKRIILFTLIFSPFFNYILPQKTILDSLGTEYLPLNIQNRWQYLITNYDSDGPSYKLSYISVVLDTLINEKTDNEILKIFSLSQNYPNPFNPSTIIKYSIPQTQKVTIKVYDVLGNEVATLVNEEKPAGSYEVTFNGSNLSSGIYFYQIQAGDFTASRKMILIK